MLILNLSFLMYLFFSQKVLSQISSEFVYAVTPLEQDLLIAGNTRVRVASGSSRRPQRSHAHHLHAKSPSLHLCLAFLSSSLQVKWAQMCSCRCCTIMWYRHTEVHVTTTINKWSRWFQENNGQLRGTESLLKYMKSKTGLDKLCVWYLIPLWVYCNYYEAFLLYMIMYYWCRWHPWWVPDKRHVLTLPLIQPFISGFFPQPRPLSQRKQSSSSCGHPQLWEEVWLCAPCHSSLHGRHWCLHSAPHGLGEYYGCSVNHSILYHG